MVDSDELYNRLDPLGFDADQAVDQIMKAYLQALQHENTSGYGATPAYRRKHADTARVGLRCLLKGLGERCAAILADEQRLDDIYQEAVDSFAADAKRREDIYQEAVSKTTGLRAGVAFLPRPFARANSGIEDQRIRRLAWAKMGPAADGSSLRAKLEELRQIPGRREIFVAKALPTFYPGTRLIHIFMREYHNEGAILWSGDAFALEKKPDEPLIMFDWSNGPIYQLNREGFLRISGGAETYLRFFFHLVRGRHGRFLILENEDDLKKLVSWNDPPAPGDSDKKSLAAEICRPIALKEIDASGRLVHITTMLFKDSMVEVDVTLDGNGLVDMGSPEWRLDDLPVQWEG